MCQFVQRTWAESDRSGEEKVGANMMQVSARRTVRYAVEQADMCELLDLSNYKLLKA